MVCSSTVSSQVVRLDASGARYLGETAVGFPAPRSLDGGTVTTASGITCSNTARGIECSGGDGEGFVIGDTAVVLRHGPFEERFEWPSQPDPAPAPAPAEPPQVYELTDPVDGLDYDCADFGSREEAQAFYEADPYDSSGLDGDFDGVACETLPAVGDAAPAPSWDDPAAPAAAPSSGLGYDCADFPSPAAAQDALDADPSDPSGLDGGGDGLACEDL